MVYGKLKQRLEFIQILMLSFALLGVGYVGIGLAHDYAQVLASLIPVGLGLGVLMPNLNVWVASVVPDALRGRALAGVTSFFFLGQFLSPIISQAIAQQVGLAATYSLAGGLLIILSTLLLLMQRQINRPTAP
jgi:MFS family permease